MLMYQLYVSLVSFVCLFVCLRRKNWGKLLLTGISYRAIEFVAEHPINHNLLLQCHSSHLKLSKRKRDFKIQILKMNFTLPLHCFSPFNFKFASTCLCRSCLVVCLFRSRRLSEIEGKFGRIRSIQTSDPGRKFCTSCFWNITPIPWSRFHKNIFHWGMLRRMRVQTNEHLQIIFSVL